MLSLCRNRSVSCACHSHVVTRPLSISNSRQSTSAVAVLQSIDPTSACFLHMGRICSAVIHAWDVSCSAVQLFSCLAAFRPSAAQTLCKTYPPTSTRSRPLCMCVRSSSGCAFQILINPEGKSGKIWPNSIANELQKLHSNINCVSIRNPTDSIPVTDCFDSFATENLPLAPNCAEPFAKWVLGAERVILPQAATKLCIFLFV